MSEQFERLINVLHEKAPQAKVAFNSQPADSDKAALRWLPTAPSASEYKARLPTAFDPLRKFGSEFSMTGVVELPDCRT
jgi:hypothetical protein